LLEHLECLEAGLEPPADDSPMREDLKGRPGEGTAWGSLEEVLADLMACIDHGRIKIGMGPHTRAELLEGLRRLQVPDYRHWMAQQVIDALNCVRAAAVGHRVRIWDR